jgi:hypothetical protein
MDESEADTAASALEDRTETSTKRCEHCGSPIDTSDWYPVTNERHLDGSIRLHHFCTEDCRAAWRGERDD